ncbi:MAG: hypothetical protein CSA84_06790 [Actinomycetales bacterium]|nr:MAG: hypothetical protein CSA84_06790 [Actinomycetales bacterium]
MATQALTHSTVELTRDLTSPPEEVFAAYADLDARTEWVAPEGQEMVYSDGSFRKNGTDKFKCGPTGQAEMDGQVRYVEIDKDTRIVYLESMTMGTDPVAVSLVSWQLDPSTKGTRLTVVSQVCSYIGDDIVEGTREGLGATLDQLSKYLENR